MSLEMNEANVKTSAPLKQKRNQDGQVAVEYIFTSIHRSDHWITLLANSCRVTPIAPGLL